MPILPRFYVYVLCRPNGKPFYVGKGSGRRVFKHDPEMRAKLSATRKAQWADPEYRAKMLAANKKAKQ